MNNHFPLCGPVLLLALCVSVLFPQSPAADADKGAEGLASHKARLEDWLAVAGLSGDWEIEKLRWDHDPSPGADPNREVLLLELRFRGGFDQDVADKQLLQDLALYEAHYHETAPERIFYRMVHECHVSPKQAAVTLRIVGREYVVFYDSQQDELRMQPRADRSYSREIPLQLPNIDSSVRQASALRAANFADRRTLSEFIGTFLRDYFTNANRQANLPGPRLDPDDVDNRDHDHVGFTISGVKSQVLRDKPYWEEIEISLDVVQAPSGVKLLCHMDAYYAAGRGSKLPDRDAYNDTRKDYPDEFKRFSDGLLSQLQKRIEMGH